MSRNLSCFRLQDPCLDMPYPISIAGSLQNPPGRILYRTLAQDPCVGSLCDTILGPSARSMSPGPREYPCLRIHLSGSTCANPLQDAYLRTHVSPSESLSVGPLQDPSQDTLPNPWLNVSGSMSLHHASASLSVDAICKIHVSRVHTCDPGRRSRCPDACLSVHIRGFTTE